MTISELLSTPSAISQLERTNLMLERIALALEAMNPEIALSSEEASVGAAGAVGDMMDALDADEGSVDFADDTQPLRAPINGEEEVDENERVLTKRERDERIAIAAGSDSY